MKIFLYLLLMVVTIVAVYVLQIDPNVPDGVGWGALKDETQMMLILYGVVGTLLLIEEK